MNLTKKPSRKDLLKVIAELQQLVGSAHGLHANDRNPMGFEEGQKKLEAAHELCIQARSFDPPTDQ
jgi:hypothetical protein